MTIQMKALDEYILMVLFLIFTKESSFLHFPTFINLGGNYSSEKVECRLTGQYSFSYSH